jgi:tellurite resistance protein
MCGRSRGEEQESDRATFGEFVMALSEQELITYLANVIHLARIDGALSPKETAAIEDIRVAMGAKKGALNAAVKAVEAGTYCAIKAGPFAVQVSNVADMLYVCIVDGELGNTEKTVLTEFCQKVGVTQEQVNLMAREAVTRASQSTSKITCPHCSAEIPGDAKFCSKCGQAVKASDPVPLAFQIPSAGYAIEFCESSAAGFADALATAKTAPKFSSIVRNKKTWYLACWPDNAFEKVAAAAELLSGIRNRKAYQLGVETPWEDLFGFAWCASERSRAYRPVEYCFGKDEKRVNPWGCKQVQMDWSEWARWFSYGQFRRTGLMKSNHIWTFDKERIRHEAMANLHRFRHCPHLRLGLIDAVLNALPNEVEIMKGGPWKYSQAYEDVPGAISIVEIEDHDGYEYKSEYRADGVRPRGVAGLEALLRKAFTDAGVTDVTPAQIVR